MSQSCRRSADRGGRLCPSLALLVVLAAAVAFGPGPTRVASYYLTPGDNWFGLLNGSGLAPGDEVILGAGVYSTANRLSLGHVGTAADPIVIRAADGANVVFTRPNASQNVINIEGSQYLTLRGLEITGGSAGIRIGSSGGVMPVGITIEQSHLHHLGEAAITANFVGDVYDGLVFRYNQIDHTGGTGEAFYLGSNNNASGATTSVFRNGLIEANFIHDLVGSGSFQGDGVEIKDGSYNNIVRDNVIYNTHYPGVLVYGTDGYAPNIIERNVIINSQENGIQAAADAIIRNNIILNAAGNGLFSMDHQSAEVGNLSILANTILSYSSSGYAIRINAPGDGTISGPILVANNALYDPQSALSIAASGVTLAGNVISTNLAADFADAAAWDVYLITGSALLGAANPAYVTADDFNQLLRGGDLTVGAYLYDAAGNPGWVVDLWFKALWDQLRGDFDSDGDVDGNDFLIWQNGYPTASGGVRFVGDADGDGDVDGNDFLRWQNNYPSTLIGLGLNQTDAVAVVPEPASLALLALGAAALALGRRRVGPEPRPHSRECPTIPGTAATVRGC